MTGWKTKASAYLAIFYGIAGVLLGLHDFDQAMNYLITGLGILGVGHKIEKVGATYEKTQNDDVDAVIRRNSAGKR